MARQIISSQNFADTGDAVQLFSKGRFFAITFKARPSNAESIYIGDDSAAKGNGFQLLPGDREDRVYHPVTADASKVWVWASDSGDDLDYWALMEN